MFTESLRKWILSVTALSFLFSAPLHSSAQTKNLYGETDTKWPGIKLKITNLVRVDVTHVVAVLRMEADAKAPDYTFIGDIPKDGLVPPPSASRKEISSGKYDPIPYSLAVSKVIDETTHQEFQAEKVSPQGYASNSMVTNLYRNSWANMSVSLNVPPPQPAGNDGKSPPQIVTILLPKATHAIEHVVLPTPTPAPAATPAPAGNTTRPATAQATPR